MLSLFLGVEGNSGLGSSLVDILCTIKQLNYSWHTEHLAHTVFPFLLDEAFTMHLCFTD